jgi:parallel beta-helix repeat protein
MLAGCGILTRPPRAVSPTAIVPRPTIAPAVPDADQVGLCATQVARQAPLDRGTPAATASSSASARPLATSNVAVGYDAATNTITLRKGSATTLAALSHALDRPAALRERATGEWLLDANLRVERGAELRIAAPEVTWLKLRSDASGFVSIKALGGKLVFAGVCATAWDSARNSFDDDDQDGRSFVLARDGAQMDIDGAELSHLGYDANESYGVAWRLSGTSGVIANSRFGHNFYGLYSYEASDLVIRGNEVDHSQNYGIDPHTRANRLLIEGNVSHHNGKQGIILAEECSDATVRNNIVYANTLHGIVIYQRSNHNLVEGNTSYSNGLQGININDSSSNTVRNNTVYDNVEAGIGLGQDAQDNLLSGNIVRDNRKDGISLYSDAATNVLRDNQVSGNTRYGIYVKSEGNTIPGGNHVFGNAVGVYLNVSKPPEVSQQTNRIYDNHEADVRTGKS